MLQFGNKSKDVSFNIQFNKILRLEEAVQIYLPPFKLLDITKKESLLDICRNDVSLNRFLPDKDDLKEISRDFLLTVSNYITISLFTVKEKIFGIC